MCGSSSPLDEQRLIYVYQGLNVVLKLLSQHLDQNSTDTLAEAYRNADSGKIVAMAAMALKNGKITRQQYDKIFDAAMGVDTVQTQAYRDVDINHPNNQAYLEAHTYLNQYRR